MSTAHPAQATPERAPRVLLVAGSCVVAAVAVAVVVGAATSGTAGAYGALVGGGIALVFFLFGSVVVAAATRFAPEAAMVMALMTYTLQVALVALAFAALSASGALGDTLARGWLAGGVVAATVAWTAGQMVASSKARVPAYDIELPDASARPAQTPPRASDEGREVGAP